MNTERYTSLAEAYGADIRRWPDADRDAARDWQAREPEAARRALAEALVLDEALDAWRPPAASADLRERILALAPKPRAVLSGVRLWLSGAGLAAACAAGVVVGMAGSSAAVSDARADELLAAAAAPDDPSASLIPFTVSDRQTQRRDA